MSNLAKKYSEYPNRDFKVVKGRNQQNKSKLFFVLLLIFAIIGGTIVSLSDNPNPDSKSAPESSIDWENPPCLPSDLSSDWEETTNPERATNSNRRDFRNTKTGEKIAFDKGIPNGGKYTSKDHWHRYNPNGGKKVGRYLDANGNPANKGSGASHIFTDCK